MITATRDSFVSKVVSIISVCVLVVGVFPVAISANSNDSCNQETTYTKSSDFSDSRVNINFESSDTQIDVSAATGYQVVKVELEVSDDGHSGFHLYATGAVNNLNPNPGGEIQVAKVTVKKICPDVCPNISGDQFSVPSGMELYNGQCVAEPTVSLTGVSSCVASNGTYSITWTLTNNATDRQMENESDSFDGDDNTTGSSFNVGVTDPTFSSTFIAAGGLATAVSNHDTDAVQRVRATVNVQWQSSPSDTTSGGFSGEQDSVTTIVNYGAPCVPPPPVDVCPNVNGVQATGPCADSLCLAPNTWNIGAQTCDAPPACPIDTIGVFPICLPIVPEVCPIGFVGVPPICTPIIVPDIDLCPEPGFQIVLPCASVTPTDTDEDGIADEIDNCDSTENADQVDTDNDGIGDACDSNEGTEGEEENTPTETVVEEPKKRGGHINAICENNEDDDNDGLYDMNDPGCDAKSDSSEENPVGGVGGAEVLGASCPVLNVYLGLTGQTNDPEAVKVVQSFLNTELGLTLEVNGEYDAATIDAVKAFQSKYSTEILGPWGISDSTGIVFKTTQRMINVLSCPGLDIPMPSVN